ncbi:MAG: hypothetical protein AAFR39_13805 [Pseudomonadota bacterium]
MDRRQFMFVTAGAFTASAMFPKLSIAANPSGISLHGLSAFGDLKYADGFSHFEYNSPDAPVGGASPRRTKELSVLKVWTFWLKYQ